MSSQRDVFTSLKAPDHPENEFEAVKQLMEDALRYQEQWLRNTIEAAFRRMEEEHRSWLDEQKEEAIATHDSILSSYSEEELAQLFIKETELRDEFEKHLNKTNDLEKQFELERAQLLKNAYLMPAETRELAEQFLLAEQPDFKVGLLFSKRRQKLKEAAVCKTLRQVCANRWNHNLNGICGKWLLNFLCKQRLPMTNYK
ncbi:hypothetical protein ACI2OX_11090 [Bacillus sp. N9]